MFKMDFEHGLGDRVRIKTNSYDGFGTVDWIKITKWGVAYRVFVETQLGFADLSCHPSDLTPAPPEVDDA